MSNAPFERAGRPGVRFQTHLPRPPEERAGQRPASRLNNCTDEAHLLRAYLETLEAALIYEENEGGGGSHSWLARHIWMALTNLEEELQAVTGAVKAEGEGHTGSAGPGTSDAGDGPAGVRR